jgi:hypothetical protein
MARGTAGTNTQISGTYTSHLGLTNFSMACWIRRPSAASTQGIGFNEAQAHRTSFLYASDNRIYSTIANGSNAFGSSLQNVTGWHHCVIAYDGSQATNATRLKQFFDGIDQTLTFSGTIPATLSSNASNETFRVGRAAGNNTWSTGDFADFAMWDATLNAGEANTLAKGFSADKVRPSNLLSYIPMVRNIQDIVSATTLTDASTTAEPHPRIYA